MSIKVMSWVWEQDFNHSEQAVMLALADHANDLGKRIFPSVKRVAWKTGYSERQVQRIIAGLREKGILVVVAKASWDRPTEYNIAFDKSTPKAPWKSDETDGEERVVGGDKMSPGDIAVTQRDDIATAKRDDIVTSSKPSVTISKPSSMADADAPPPIPSPGEKFGRTEKDAVRKDAETYFSQVTGLAITEGMTARSRGQLWYGPLREVCALAQWDYRRVHELIDAACARLRKVDYTICDPNSIIKTVRALAAEPTTPQAPKQVATTNWQRIG